jgi:hypothetical protein
MVCRDLVMWMMTIRFLRYSLSVCLLLAGWGATSAESNCRVVDVELATSYSGSCDAQGLAEGTGIAEGTARYTGQFIAGRKHGRGIKVWPSGDRYEGEFANDYRHGEGMYSWGALSANAGDSYRGEYRDDSRHGIGTYRWASGEQYEGPWENDAMRGLPTAMAIQRGRHQAAVRVSVMKIGATVCREFATMAARGWMYGVVEEVNIPAMTMSITLDGKNPRPDGVMLNSLSSEMAVDWELCQ